jgi:hypothetical protein
MLVAGDDQTATLLPDGSVLLTVGFGSDGEPLASAELFKPRRPTARPEVWAQSRRRVPLRSRHRRPAACSFHIHSSSTCGKRLARASGGARAASDRIGFFHAHQDPLLGPDRPDARAAARPSLSACDPGVNQERSACLFSGRHGLAATNRRDGVGVAAGGSRPSCHTRPGRSARRGRPACDAAATNIVRGQSHKWQRSPFEPGRVSVAPRQSQACLARARLRLGLGTPDGDRDTWRFGRAVRLLLRCRGCAPVLANLVR